jgi:hypothetical protein
LGLVAGDFDALTGALIPIRIGVLSSFNFVASYEIPVRGIASASRAIE